MKMKIKDLENSLNCKIKKNFTSVGFDFATRAGISFLTTDAENIKFDYLFIEFKTNNVKDKYKTMVGTIQGLLNCENLAVIEDIFVGFNPDGSLELAKYHAFVIAECIKKGIDYETISAKCCRGKCGILTTKKAGYGKGQSKKAVADWLKNKMNLELDDEDISDSIILALLGIIDGMDFKPKSKGGKKLA